MRLPLALLVATAGVALGFASGCRGTSPTEDGSEVKFYGTDARRAAMSFETTLWFDLPVGWTGDVSTIHEGEFKDEIDEAISLQLAHMFGAFVGHTKPHDFTASPGIPRERPTTQVIDVTRVPGHAAARVRYSYEDVVVFKKSLFHGGDTLEIEFLLPENPGGIFEKGQVPIADAKKIYADDEWALEDIKHWAESGEKTINLCTDLHYNSEGDYWYFWNPYQRGCPQATRDATIKVTATLDPLNSTAKTWPRYKQLYGDNGNGKDMRITYLVGVDENFRRGDLGRLGFKKAYRLLTEGKAILSAPDAATALSPGEKALLEAVPEGQDVVFKASPGGSGDRHKVLVYEGNGYTVRVNMYLVDPNSEDFVQKAVQGLRESDVFLYDGHSGLGGYLSVGRLFERRHYTLPLDKYQVFFFNGCSTFSYYNYDYFQLKATEADPEGRKNLEILTTSTPALFDRGPGSDVWLLRNLASGKRPTWQAIVDDIYKIAAEESALVAVNGDEDELNRVPGGDQ